MLDGKKRQPSPLFQGKKTEMVYIRKGRRIVMLVVTIPFWPSIGAGALSKRDGYFLLEPVECGSNSGLGQCKLFELFEGKLPIP